MPGQIDWQNPNSIWYTYTQLHRMQPDGDDYPRYLWVRDRIPEGSRVLDAGCGAGQFALNITRDRGCEVCGVDVVPEFVERCNRIVRKQLGDLAGWGWFVCADFSKMTTDQVQAFGPFDVVTAMEVIEHPVDVRGFRDNALLALKPGGKLIITTPHPDSRSVGYGYMYRHAHHVRMWTRWRLEQVFGLTIDYSEITRDQETERGGTVSHIGGVWIKEE